MAPALLVAGIDRAIRLSTAVAVLVVAGVAAYVSYWHAYAVVRAYGETWITARLEPATIDGLVYANSMVMPLRDHAALLAEAIRDEACTRAVLIGHSMGGIVCLAAVQKLIDDWLRTKDGRMAIDRIAGVILMAAPLAGSLRAFTPLSWVVTDGLVLRAL
jgi:pimeloyl-ACP methyl ester carboxylesterase